MYDTIMLWLGKKDIGDEYNYENVLRKIYKTCTFEKVRGGCGYYENLRISVTENRVLCTGSFSKFQKGNNVNPISMEQLKKVINYLSRVLGVPMEKADVLVVDIAENFVMEKSPELYKEKMRNLGTFSSNNWESTKYFSSRDTTVRFYNKTGELRQKNHHRPKRERCSLPEREKKNLLRYEVRFKKGKIRQMFGRGLKACDLYNKNIYWRFISEWLGCYDDIDKLPDSVLNITFEQIKTQRDMEDWCICLANTFVNIPEFIKGQVFKHRENPQEGDRQYHKRLQDRLHEALAHYQDYMTPSDLIPELTKKIEDRLTWLYEESSDAYEKD